MWQVVVTRKRGGSRASSVGGSFTSGRSFIAAQHSGDEGRPFAEGPLTREDRSMTHEGILLHETPQVCRAHHLHLLSAQIQCVLRILPRLLTVYKYWPCTQQQYSRFSCLVLLWPLM